VASALLDRAAVARDNPGLFAAVEPGAAIRQHPPLTPGIGGQRQREQYLVILRPIVTHSG
jgi:hypothetical protein